MINLKKSITVLVLIVSLTTFGQNDWKKQNLKANPKAMKNIVYNIVENFGAIKRTGVVKGVNFTYNELGFVITQNNYGQNAQPINQLHIFYDTLYNIKSKNLSDKDGKLINRVNYKYNQRKKPTYESIYRLDGSLVSRKVYTYNKKKVKPLKVVSFDSNGQKKEVRNYTYRKWKHLKKVKTINPETKVVKNIKVFDENNNLLKVSIFDVLGSLTSMREYKYKNNQLITILFYENEKLQVQQDFTYNNLGFLVKEEVKTLDSKKVDIITYTYDFDNKENWVKKTKFINFIPVSLEERAIDYFQN